MTNLLKKYTNREGYLSERIPKFAHEHRDLLLIVCDPKTDRIFVTYRDHFVNGKIKGINGRSAHAVRDVLKHSQFDKAIDGFLVSIMESLKLPIPRAQHFYKFLDGALFNIAKSFRKKRKDEAPKGSILSPFVGSGMEND